MTISQLAQHLAATLPDRQCSRCGVIARVTDAEHDPCGESRCATCLDAGYDEAMRELCADPSATPEDFNAVIDEYLDLPLR